MVTQELNENDNKLLAYCFYRRRHLSEIAREIDIDVKNVSARIEKLEKQKKINVEMIGNKKYIRTISGDKTLKYFAELLESLKSKGGEMKQQDFLQLLPFEFGKVEDSDKFSAPMRLLYIQHPKLVEQYVKLTPEGKKFLEEIKK